MDSYAAAKCFLEKLGFTDEDLDSLLARGVESSDDDGMSVPTLVKKAWQKWCIRGHPDKGGDHFDFTAVKQQYTDFKSAFNDWLQAPPTQTFKVWCREMDDMRGAQERAAKKSDIRKKGERCLKGARETMEEGRYEDAKREARLALQHFQDYKTAQGRAKGRDIDEIIQTKALIAKAEEAIKLREEEIRLREEEERKKRELEELKQGLDALWHAVCHHDTTRSGQGVARKMKLEQLHAHFREEQVTNLPTFLLLMFLGWEDS